MSETNDARLARYADAIRTAVSYLPEETRTEDWLYEARAVVAVADAEQAELRAEVERLEDNVSALLCELTGGRLSKTTYDVRTMAREIEAYFQETDDDDLKAAEAALASEREAHAGLRARLEALLPTEEYEDAGVLVQPSKIRAALAPVAAEEGGERCDSCGAEGIVLTYSPDHSAYFCDGCYAHENAPTGAPAGSAASSPTGRR